MTDAGSSTKEERAAEAGSEAAERRLDEALGTMRRKGNEVIEAIAVEREAAHERQRQQSAFERIWKMFGFG